MSGSGAGGGGGIDGRPVSCEDLRFTTQLASPQVAVVSKLSKGQTLQVDIATVGATQVLVVQAGGANAGSLVGTNATRLRECILAGSQYLATVVDIQSGQVTLQIEHV